jgi:molybdenum cofactor guanylyltransferase
VVPVVAGSIPVVRPKSTPDENRIAAVILAGGEARRMGGGDKPLRTLAGQSMLARILATLTPDHSAIAISANGDPARFATTLPVLPDAIAGQGPLAGVLAGLEWAAGIGADTVLTVPGDTPLIPPGLARALAPAPAVAESGGQVHHLVALWPVSAAPALRAWLSQPGGRSVHRFAVTLGMRQVSFAGDPFPNVNTPDELAALEARLRDGPA